MVWERNFCIHWLADLIMIEWLAKIIVGLLYLQCLQVHTLLDRRDFFVMIKHFAGVRLCYSLSK